MFSSIRERFTVTNVVLTLALVFAMTGGAYAANKYLITSTKQISPKVLKALQGKPGTKGANGTNGANGSNGAPGPAGAKGENGANGTNGTDGQSVASATEPKGANCKEGGTKLTVGTGTPAYACNGEKGVKGSPWTAGGTLPTEATETGGWTMGDGNTAANGTVTGELAHAAISFTIPLTKTLDHEHVQGNPVGFPAGAGTKETENCPGNVEEPKAKAGFLCVYTGEESEMNGFTVPVIFKLSGVTNILAGVPGASTAGAMIIMKTNGIHSYAVGSWAVTGE